jgi:hypothetical protein
MNSKISKMSPQTLAQMPLPDGCRNFASCITRPQMTMGLAIKRAIFS